MGLPGAGQPPEGHVMAGGSFDAVPGWREEAELRGGGFGQWRQLREQAAALAPEVAELRKQVDEGTAILRAELEQERAARSLLERKLSSQDEVLSMLRQKMPEGGSSMPSGGLPSFLREVRESFGRELKDCTAAQRRLEQRYNDLHEVVNKPDGGLQMMVRTLHTELLQEVHARERHGEQVKEMFRRHAPEEAPEFAQACEDSLRTLEARLSEHVSLAREQQSTLQERIRHVERALSESADSHTRDLEAVHTRLQDKMNGRLWEFHGSLRDLYCELKDRVERMEEAGSRGGTAATAGGGAWEARDRDNKRLNELEAHLREARQAQERELAALVQERNEYHATVQERFQQLESLHGKAAGKHAQDLEATYSRLAEEAEVRDVTHMSLKTRLDSMEKSFKDLLREHASKGADELQTALGALRGEFQERLFRCQADHTQRLQEHARHLAESHGKASAALHAHLDDEREARETQEAWVKDNLTAEREVRTQHERAVGGHLGALEQRLGQDAARLRDELEALKRTWTEHCDSVAGQLLDVRGVCEAHERSVRCAAMEERKAREAHEAQLALLHDRLAQLARVLGEAPAGDAEPAGANVPQGHASLRDHLAGFERRLHELSERTDQHVEHLQATNRTATAGEQQARSALHQTLSERIDCLEKQQHDALRAHGSALETMLQRHVQSLADTHAGEVAAGLQSAKAELQGRLDREREAREKDHAAAMEEAAREHGVAAQRHSALSDRLSALERRHGEDVAALAEELRGTPQASFYDSVREHLACEKKARESHERLMQSQAAQERQARELHSTSVQEQLAQERQARERQHEQIQQLSHGMASREVSQKSIQELMTQERARIQALMGQVKSDLQEMLSEEKAEWTRHHSAVSARVDSLQRTLDIFDTIIRKEISERSEEGRRMRLAPDEMSRAPAPPPSGAAAGEDGDQRALLQHRPEPITGGTEQGAPAAHSLPSAPDRRVGAAFMTKPVCLGTATPPTGPSSQGGPRPLVPAGTGGSYCASPQRSMPGPLWQSAAAPPPQVVVATSGYTTCRAHGGAPASPTPAAGLAQSASASELRPHARGGQAAAGRAAGGGCLGTPPPKVSLRHSTSSGSLSVPPVAGMSTAQRPAGGSLGSTATGSWQPPPVRIAAPVHQRATVPLVPSSGRSMSHSPSARGRLTTVGSTVERAVLPTRELQHWVAPLAEPAEHDLPA
uniref:Uncharacterized protein n=1 Tax=Alexandrium monilatum TaxID=311494 RepID=A0A7S4QJL1_9DINO